MTEPAKAPTRFRAKLTRTLLMGFAVLLPVFLTGYILYAVTAFVDTHVGRFLARWLGKLWGEVEPSAATRVAADILAVVAALALLVTAGAATASFLGKRIVAAVQRLMLRVPIVNAIYPHVKQITDFFLGSEKRRFHSVVAVPYPRKGSYAVGFVTGQGIRSLNEKTGEDLVHVFVPSSPTPVTGSVLLVPRREVIELPWSVDDALRFCVSGGVIVPPQDLVDTALAVRKKAEGAEPALSPPVWAADE